MTTVFADLTSGVMVCDSKCTSGGSWYPMTKVYRFGDELIGIAGNIKDCTAWLKWYRGGKRGPRPKLESFAALSLTKDRLLDMSEDGLEMLVERGFLGIGSGGPCATAAFMAGADPVKAVQIACQIDMGSGGDVISHSLFANKES